MITDSVCEYWPSGLERLERHFAMVWLDVVRECCPSGLARLERHFARFFFVVFLGLVCKYCPKWPGAAREAFRFGVAFDLVRKCCPSGPEPLERHFAWCGFLMLLFLVLFFVFRFGVRILPKWSGAAREAFRHGEA